MHILIGPVQPLIVTKTSGPISLTDRFFAISIVLDTDSVAANQH